MLAVIVFSILLEKQCEIYPIHSVSFALSIKEVFYYSKKVIQQNVLSVSAFEEGGMRSDCGTLPRDGALLGLTLGTGPLYVRASVCLCLYVYMSNLEKVGGFFLR